MIDPAEVVFPMRCIFTNEPVEELPEMTLHHVETERTRVGQRIRERLRPYSLPVSPAWIARRATIKKRIGRALLIGGGILFLLAILLGIVFTTVVPNLLSDDAKGIVLGPLGAIAISAIIIGLAWPHLKGSESDPRTIAAQFADESDPRDWILVFNVHPDFLASLPETRSLPGRG
jgi:hypothetical protein